MVRDGAGGELRDYWRMARTCPRFQLEKFLFTDMPYALS